jgi:hypothetical protein
MGYFSIWIFINSEKTIENITIINSGFNKAQKKPKAAVLYLTLKSLSVRLYISPL